MENPLQNRRWFLACMAFGPILVFTIASLWGTRSFFHWQAPGYLFVFPLLGEAVAACVASGKKWTLRWITASVVAFVLLVGVAASHTVTGWLKNVEPQWFAYGDPTADAVDWIDLREQLGAKGWLNPDHAQFVVSSHWIDSGKIDYALEGKIPLLSLAKKPHHFAFMHEQTSFQGKTALLVGQRHYMDHAMSMYRPYFNGIEPLGTVWITRAGREEIELVIYRGYDFNGKYPLPYSNSTQHPIIYQDGRDNVD